MDATSDAIPSTLAGLIKTEGPVVTNEAPGEAVRIGGRVVARADATGVAIISLPTGSTTLAFP